MVVSLRSKPSAVIDVLPSMYSGSVRQVRSYVVGAGLCWTIDHHRFLPVRAGNSSAQISIRPSSSGFGIQCLGGRTSVWMTG